MSGLITVNAGFLPLTDCMILVAAKEKGFALEAGIDLVLSREQSWASIRDHMAVGHYDVAHLLAPMPIAFNAGLIPFSVPVIAPMALGLGGNAVTVSTVLWEALEAQGAGRNGDPLTSGKALRKVIRGRAQQTEEKLKFGVVHPFSGHNLEMRYWLSSCGIDPRSDLEILVVPPPLMPDALASGRIDGYCVGEPWNSIAVERNVGRISTTKAAIWRSSPEKVLGVQSAWAELHPDLLSALIQALHSASKWCSDNSNQIELSHILSRPEYVGASPKTIQKALSGSIELQPGKNLEIADFMIPFERAATFPWQSHALWFYTQMVRWGLVEHTAHNVKIARESYRPDLYRTALLNSDAAIPAASMKVEGALELSTAVGSSGRLSLGPDGFFDERIFDPDRLDEYLFEFKD